jgi:hypothetical protein
MVLSGFGEILRVPMSQANLRVVKTLFPPNRELDGRSIAEKSDMVRNLFQPLITSDFTVAAVAAGLTTASSGPVAMADVMREYMDAFSEHRTIIERYVEGDDVVVALGEQRGRTRTHGVKFDAEVGIAFFFEASGRLKRIEAYQHWTEALEAAGLSE